MKYFIVHPDENLYEMPEEAETSRMSSSFSSVTLRKKGKYTSSYNIEDKFSFKVSFITNLNVQSAEVRVDLEVLRIYVEIFLN